MTVTLDSSSAHAAMRTPDIKISVRQTFNIDVDMEVPAFDHPT